MRIKGKLSSTRLLVPFLLLAGAQIIAQAAANGGMPAADPASLQMTRPHADVVVISDRTFLMKSIEGTMNQGFKSSGCNSGILAVALGRPGGDRCPIVECAAPPPGCSYGPPDTDQNGCAINCGPLVCGPDNN
jgi:hypothetical protein